MSLLSKSLKFSVGTFLSRLTGLLRDVVVASVFGASSLLDAFLLANRIPNLLRDMLAEGALGSSFTKVYSSLSVESKDKAYKLLSDILKLIFLVVLIICIFGIIFSPLLVKCFTFLSSSSGRDSTFYSNAIVLTRILFPTLIFAVCGAILMGVLSEKGKFFLQAVSSIFLNLGYIVGALILARVLSDEDHLSTLFSSFLDIQSPSVIGLALGVVIGSACQLFSLVLGTIKELSKISFFSSFKISDDVKKVIYLLIPAAIGSSAGSINVFINTNFAASLPTGSITWLNYAFRLVQLPVGLFGVAIGIVALPSLSKKVTLSIKEHRDLPSEDFQKACILTLWLLIPCFSIILLNNFDLINLIYGYGKFDAGSIENTSLVLIGYSFCLIPYGLIKVVTSFYYALDKTSYAMKVSLIGIAINLIGCIFLTSRFQAIGLSVASSCTLSFNLAILLYHLKSLGVKIFDLKFLKSLLWLLLSLSISVVLFYLLKDPMHRLLDLYLSSKISSHLLCSKLISLIQLSFNSLIIISVFLIVSCKAYSIRVSSFKNFFKRTK